MVKTSRLRFGALVAAGVASMTLGAGCGSVIDRGDTEPVVIGVDLPLSGERSALGEVYQQALELRVEQVNEDGRLGGDRRLELETLDNRSDDAASAENLISLANDDSVSAIVTAGCQPCLSEDVVTTLTEQSVPTISLGGASGVIGPVEERRPIFKLGPNAADNAAILTANMVDAGIDTLGLVVTDDSYGLEGQEAMTAEAQRSEIEIAVNQTITAEGDNIEAVAAEVVAYQEEQSDQFVQPVEPEEPGPDAVAVWAPPAVAGEFAVALGAEGYDKPLYLDAVAADDVLLVGEAGAALDAATIVFTETLVIDDVIATSPAKAERKAWVRDYTAQFGDYDAVSSFAADAVELVVQAISRSEGAAQDRQVLLSAIEAIQIEGLSGTIQMRPNQHSGLISQSLTTLVAQGDRWRPSA